MVLRLRLLAVLGAVLALAAPARPYLLLLPDALPAAREVFDASVYKLGSERHYQINSQRTANFVHHLFRVDPARGTVALRKRLRCDGILYPNLFTVYIESTSNRIRDIDYYSLPLRILITGHDCGYGNDLQKAYAEEELERGEEEFDNDHIDDDSNQDSSDYDNTEYFHRDKRDISFANMYPESVDVRLLEDDEFQSSLRSKRTRHMYGPRNYDLKRTKRELFDDEAFYSFQMAHLRKSRRKRNYAFDMAIHTKLSVAKQWISETYASFSIPTADKWNQICLRKSQFINSLSAFLPRTIQQHCKVFFLHVDDERFAIESTQGDLVASDDVCIQEQLWKVTVLFGYKCDRQDIIDTEHRLKIVYHHQEFNDTDIAKRVRRELRNQSPFFEQALYVASVAEEQEPGTLVTTVRARDPENSPVTYSMTSILDSRSQGLFGLDTRLGTVSTLARLDREQVDVHYFRVTAVDDSFPPRSGTTTLQVNVLDCNDHTPVFELQEYEASIREGASQGSTIITLKATDKDFGKNAEVEYSINSVTSEGDLSTDEEDAAAFRMDQKTGVLSTRSQLDREKASRYTVIVLASDQASPITERKTASATVIVRILDDNDNYPQFSERTYTVSVNEDVNLADNPVIAHISAVDADAGSNAAIRYAIIGGNTQLQFSIDSLSGDVSLVKPLDYELMRNYRLVIRAQDGGSPSRSNTTQLLVNIKDVNDNVPRFYTSLFQEAVSESVPVGYSIVRVQAYDADEGTNAELTYSVNERDLATMGGAEKFPLGIDQRTGWIFTTRQLDREEQSKFNFQVIATDGGVLPKSATASVALTVQDVNDNDPRFEPPRYEANLAEDEPPGTPVVTVTATDPDEDNRLHYELTGGNTRGRFAITSQNGRGLITVAQPLDFKQERRYVLTVTASDSGGRSDTAMVHINITDANNFAPVFENAPYTAAVFEDAPIGTTVLVVSATDSDVGINAQITYSLGGEISNDAMSGMEQEFTINPQTGAIVTNKLLDREAVSGYLLTVTAHDGGSPPHSDTTDVEISVTDVNDNNPSFKQPMYSASVLEDALLGTSVVQISATDADIGLNGRIRYELSSKDREDGSFIIDHSSGVIRTNKGLDRESVPSYDLHAYAVDRGTPALSTSVLVHVRIEDVNDSPPAFAGDKLTLYVAENSPIGTTVGEIHAHDPDEGVNAVVHYSIIGGDDSNSFSLVTRPGSDRAELLTMVDLDYESPRKKYELVIRAASPPLRNDVHVEILVTDVNDNAPMLKDFQIIFNNFKDCFPVGVFGKVPAFDADVTDKLTYRILSGNNANLVMLNQSTGGLVLSPQLNTNVPRLATMEISVTDGINEVKSVMQLSVRLITEEMLYNSVTIRLNDMTAEAFLSPLLSFFVDGLAAIIPCPKEYIYVFSIQDDSVVNAKILNVSFSARRPDATGESQFYSPVFLQERVYLNRAILARLATVQVLPFDDNMCVREPCLNFEECLTILKFGNASGFINSDTVLFRPIYPVTTFACQCPKGFTGSKEHYLCDAEVNLCYSSPCQNNGTCMRKEGGYTCVCSSEFTGVNCETPLKSMIKCPPGEVCKGGSWCAVGREGGLLCRGCATDSNHSTPLCELKARSFPRSSFLTFPSLRQRHRLHIKLRFATQNQNGLLLYNGRFNEHHDFVSLEVVGGGLQFSFSLGGRVSRVSATVPGGVSQGDWHTVKIHYINRTATISIDDCDTAVSLAGAAKLGARWACANQTTHDLPERCALLTETCHRFLDLTGPLQLGGLPSIPSSFQVKSKDFVGCISDLHIDFKFIDLNSFVADNGTVIGCPEKRSHCDSNPCHNGADCRDIWDTYFCECTEGYTGKDCSESISPPWRFSGDGVLSFNPLLRPIQLPWLNALSIRTRQPDTFIMSIQVGQNSSAIISLKSGLLHYTYNSETMFLPGTALSDGEWHRIEIKWLGSDISVALDYGSRLTLLPMSANKIQGLYVGKILIGGADSLTSGTLLSADYGYFEGCIQDVRVGTPQSMLSRPTVRENVRDGCHSRADCLLSACPAKGQCRARWDTTECVCEGGTVGDDCQPVCEVKPCGVNGNCVPDIKLSKGYKCSCINESVFSGEYCDIQHIRPCPSGWWGAGECGPCLCQIDDGYHPDCNKSTGQCYCREHHYQPANSTKCLACNCYSVGSVGADCDSSTGLCSCRPGVIGRACDTCSNTYAEVTVDGCQVVYDGCPRSMAGGVWWPRSKFGEVPTVACGGGAGGRASRACGPSDMRPPWREPDMFNCTSPKFLILRKQLSQIEMNELEINTFIGVKLSNDLMMATRDTPNLYGADILVTEGILMALMEYEIKQAGLNLTHSQDKDYIKNMIKSADKILLPQYSNEWRRIQELTGHSVDGLMGTFDNYITVLGESQHDTYTNPFEIVTENIVLGVDIVTPESIFGFEATQLFRKQTGNPNDFTTERVVLPDTSDFLHSPLQTNNLFAGKNMKGQKKSNSPMISFPKYNNYLQNKNKFDKHSRVYVPLDVLGIQPHDNRDGENKDNWSRAVIAYTQWASDTGSLIPVRCGPSVQRRWGVPLKPATSLMQLSVLVPHMQHAKLLKNLDISDKGTYYTNKGTKVSKSGKSDSKDVSQNNAVRSNNPSLTNSNDLPEVTTDHPPIIINPAPKKQGYDTYNKDVISENDASYLVDSEIQQSFENERSEPVALAYTAEDSNTVHGSNGENSGKLVYKSLSGLNLPTPIRLQLWLNIEPERFNTRMNPQCVHWSTARGLGEWSRVGCQTEVDYEWDESSGTPLYVNCTCNHLSTFTVLIDIIDLEFIPEPSLLEDVSSYSAFCISLPILLVVLIALMIVRGSPPTISNTIHKNLVFSVFMAEMLYFIALKSRATLVQNEVACKLLAMSLHYWWVCSAAWQACEAWQVRRMVRELRDVNHGPAGAQLAAAYGIPAIVLALAAGVRQHQYGNALFCWISWHEGLVWWVVVPAGSLALLCAVFLASAVRAAFTLRDHVLGFGNLRSVVCVSVIAAPLLGVGGASCLLLAGGGGAGGVSSASTPALSVLLAVTLPLHALTLLLGYCVFNVRVRENLNRTFLRCMGRKVPLLDTSMVTSSSGQPVTPGNRSALAYHNTGGLEGVTARRNIGISASSTTSRSTTKTSSSPYRSDGHMRHTSTSTSNYNSTSDMPSYLRGFDSSLHRHREEEVGNGKRRNSDSESEGSAGRSLDLASSHSSDDEDTSDRRGTIRPARNGDMGVGYLPNITESSPQSRASSRPTWGQGPGVPRLITGPNGEGEIGRWSQETASDNELQNQLPLPLASPSPIPLPLPNPDLTSDTAYHLRSHNVKPSILENIHETYTASVEHTMLPLDNRYGVESDYGEMKYGLQTELDKHQQMGYEPHYMPHPPEPEYGMRPSHYRQPYGPKTFLPGPENYSYSPTKFLNGENGIYGSRDFRDSGIAGFLKNDYQRKVDNHYAMASGSADFADRLSESSEKHHPHDKYLFPYTAEEDHISIRGMNQSPAINGHSHMGVQGLQQMTAPLANMAETSEKSTTEDDAETRV